MDKKLIIQHQKKKKLSKGTPLSWDNKFFLSFSMMDST